MKALLGSPILAALLSSCSLVNAVPTGVVTGVVLYNGRPAAGKPVSLVGTEKKGVTDASGRYTFTSVTSAERLYIVYKSVLDYPVTEPDDGRLPIEVERWQSVPFSLNGSGHEVPAFDVAYNGLLYPIPAASLILSPKSPVPFHWSTHPQARTYRLKVLDANKSTVFTSPWESAPTTILDKSLATGTFQWLVEIDAGDRGAGLSQPRYVFF